MDVLSFILALTKAKKIPDTAVQRAESILDDIEENYPLVQELNQDVQELDHGIKSGDEVDSTYHLGFYIDDDGDLCQK